MRFEIPTDQFASAVTTAARFCERRANLPVLSSILLCAESGRLILRATNLECGVEITIPAKVHENGIAAVPASVLSGFIANTKGKSIAAKIEGEVLKIETERSAATIKTVPYEDFPILPRVSAERSFSEKTTNLAKVIRSVVHCASTSTVKPELQSVFLYGEGGKLTAVATDSFRLAEKAIPLRSQGAVAQLLLPARNAQELIRILEAKPLDIEVYFNDNQLSVQVDSIYYTSRIIDGTFPNYQQIVPKTFSTEVVVLREDFQVALKSLAIFSDKFSQVSLALVPDKKSLQLTSRNPDVGEQTSTISATIKGEAFTMSFNSHYLGDSLQAITGESIRIQANGSGKPILIKDAADESYFYLAMPMNR